MKKFLETIRFFASAVNVLVRSSRGLALVAVSRENHNQEMMIDENV
ncbi:hypothetical protein [Listeria sp. SHR_NRA_18]|nr:hypothetical protein [Listeria sp. SHR_NRA_18]